MDKTSPKRPADAPTASLERELLRVRGELERTSRELAIAREEAAAAQATRRGLAAARADLELLLRSTGIAAVLLDRDGHIRSFTPAAAAICGLAEGDVGRPLAAVADPPGAAPALPAIEEASGRDDPVEQAWAGPDGRRYLRRVRAERGPDGAVAGFVLAWTDVTDRKRSEDALRESERKLRVALEAARLGAWERDLRTGELITTPACRVNLGVAPDYPITFEEARAMRHPDDRERIEAETQQGIAAMTDYDLQYRVMRRDGRIGTILVRGHAIYDEAGTPVRLVGVTVDVTQRVAAEQALADLERRQSFLLALNDGIRESEDPPAAMAATSAMLARHLRVGRVGYAEIEGTRATVAGDFAEPPLTSLVGVRSLDALAPGLGPDLGAGRTVAVGDVVSDPRSAGPVARAAAAGVRAVLAVPLVKDGGMAAMLFVHHAEPRAFSREEAALVEDVAERTWSAVERARAKAALRDSEERLRLSQEAGGIGLWDLNLHTGALYWSPSLRALVGVGAQTPVAAPLWQEIVHPDDQANVREAVDAALAGDGKLDTEFRIVRPADGAVIWLASRGEVFFDATGAPSRLVGVNYDVSARRRTESALREGSERLQLAMRAAALGDWRWDAETDLVTMSERAAQMFGIPAGPHLTWSAMQALLHPADAGRVAKALAAAVATRSPYDVEYRVRRPSDGAEVWVAAKGQPTFAADGRTGGVTGIVQDITDRKHAQERQHLLIRELHHRVKNTLATVQAIVSATARTASSIEAFYQGFVGRIVSLAQTHNLLTEDDWQNASLRRTAPERARTLRGRGGRAGAARRPGRRADLACRRADRHGGPRADDERGQARRPVAGRRPRHRRRRLEAAEPRPVLRLRLARARRAAGGGAEPTRLRVAPARASARVPASGRGRNRVRSGRAAFRDAPAAAQTLEPFRFRVVTAAAPAGQVRSTSAQSMTWGSPVAAQDALPSPPAATNSFSSSREPNRNTPFGVSASIEPSANMT